MRAELPKQGLSRSPAAALARAHWLSIREDQSLGRKTGSDGGSLRRIRRVGPR